MPRILVIDEEPQIRKFMRISLAANGYDVLEAENASAGVKAALEQAPDVVEIDPIRIDLTRRLVTKNGDEVHLSKREWELLEFFARTPDHVLTHKEILGKVWGAAHVEDTA